MNISVYFGASLGNNEVYIEAAKVLGKWIATNGHTLVYGGGIKQLLVLLNNY